MDQETRDGIEALGNTTAADRLLAAVEALGDKAKPFENPHPHFVRTHLQVDRCRAVVDGIETDEGKRRWLPAFPYEREELYRFRLMNSNFLGTSESSVERLVGAVFAQEPEFGCEEDAVKEWLDNTDGEGGRFRDMLEESSTEANTATIRYLLVIPRVAAVIDEETGEEIEDPSEAQVAAAGGPTVEVEDFTFEEVPSWGVSGRRVIWAAARKVVSRQPSPFDEAEEVEVWTVVTDTEIARFERPYETDANKLRELAEVSSITHGFGRIPLVPFYGRRCGPFRGKALIKASSRADLSGFHESSWGTQVRNIHANPILTLKSGRDLKKIYIGSNVVRLEDDEELDYVNIASTAFDARDSAVERFTREGMRQTGSNPTFTSDGTTFRGESGVAAKERFSHTEKRYITDHASDLAQSAGDVLTLVDMALTGSDWETARKRNDVQLFSSAEALSVDDRRSAYRDVSLEIESPTFHRVVQRQIALAIAAGATREELDQIRTEIDEQGDREPDRADSETEDDAAAPRNQRGA